MADLPRTATENRQSTPSQTPSSEQRRVDHCRQTPIPKSGLAPYTTSQFLRSLASPPKLPLLNTQTKEHPWRVQPDPAATASPSASRTSCGEPPTSFAATWT